MLDQEKLDGILKDLPFTLNKEQLTFLHSYINGTGNFVLFGTGGAGKSVMIQVLKKYYGDEMALCASTGTANQNLLNGEGGNGTSHRVFSLNFHLGDEKAMKKVNRPCSALFAGSSLIKHICIDEFLMHNPEHLHVMLKRVERFNKANSKRDKRKIRILGVGDCLQVQPVLVGNDKEYLTKTYGHHLIFKSDPWKEMNPTTYILPDSERQKDKVFKACLDVLRFGEESRYEGALKWLNKRVNRNHAPDAFTISSYLKTAEKVNKLVLNRNTNDKITYTAIVSGKFDLRENGIQESVTLCEGLECITTINDKYGEFFNGSTCVIESVTTEGCWVFFHHSGKSIFVPLHEFEATESFVESVIVGEGDNVVTSEVLSRKKIGSCWQTILSQNSAYSVHKSQGKTIEKKGVLDIGYGFNNGSDFGVFMLYVGLSRFTDVNLITLPRPLERKHIKVCRDSINFWFETLEKQNKEKQ